MHHVVALAAHLISQSRSAWIIFHGALAHISESEAASVVSGRSFHLVCHRELLWVHDMELVWRHGQWVALAHHLAACPH